MSIPDSEATGEIELVLTVSAKASGCTLTLELRHRLSKPLENWTLYLDYLQKVTPGRNTRLISRVGSHLALQPIQTQPLAPDDTCSLELSNSSTLLNRVSDSPSGCYLCAGESIYPVRLIRHNLASAVPAEYATKVQQLEQPLLPAPQRFTPSEGEFTLPQAPAWYAPPEASHAVQWLQHMTGERWPSAVAEESAVIRFRADSSLAPEAYHLDISNEQVSIHSGDTAGFCRAAASLLQLLQTSRELPCLRIEDEPEHQYRGLMLDCARHFHSPKTILDLLDWMALYKLNYFHWHLTDDEAWRLEIEAYPQLTQVGAWRGHHETLPPQLGSGPERYGGFYTREDVARVIAYAERLGITVIPEIDIPGHCRAAIQVLPDLLQENEDGSKFLSVQNFDDNILNPGLPGTYEFIEKVLAEVCDIFPGNYIHMGADEVPTGVWQDSPACKALMNREGYQNAHELQGHLLHHAQTFLKARGRTLLGWEEATRGDKLERSAAICTWTGEEAIAQAASDGHPVISCIAPWAYLDLAWDENPMEPGLYWAGTADLKACYLHAPFPEELPAGQALGVQANLWSELLSSRQKMEYMLFPRLLAIAEWGWHGKAGNWPQFHARVTGQLAYLRSRGVNARPLPPL